MQKTSAAVRALPKRAYLLLPVAAFLMNLFIELLSFSGNTGGAAAFFALLGEHTFAFLTGWLIILLTVAPVFFMRRRVCYLALVGLVWLSLGLANGFIRNKRMTPLTAPDIWELRAGIDTIPNYLPMWAIVLLCIAIVAALAGAVFLWLRGPKCTATLCRRLLGGFISVGVSAACLALSWGVGFRLEHLSDRFSNLTYAYNDYGFAYCFTQTLLGQGIGRPLSYGSGPVERISDALPADAETAEADTNIIFIQLESLLDPHDVQGLTLSEDAMPNLHAIREEFSSGELVVPVIGAGTANTEFEMLTGMSCRFFGPGEYPYKSRAQKMPVDSLASVLTDLGYTAYAIHNHRATFYNRDTVYGNLGFDYFTGLEYMPEMPRTPNNWATDGVLTGQILQALDMTEGAEDFIFTVTVQCHGSYPTEEGVIEDPQIRVEECPEELDANAMEYYFNQLYAMDAFIGELTAALEARGEPTVLVLYGDHIPMLRLTKDMLDTDSLYRTSYAVWDNIGLEKQDDVLASYQLGADVLARLGIHGSPIHRYHQSARESGTYMADLELLEYDLLYGEQYLLRDWAAPQAADIRLGMSSAEITRILPVEDGFYISGENFTPYCTAGLPEGKLLDTTYINATCLRVDGDVPEEGLEIFVVDSHHEVLSEYTD